MRSVVIREIYQFYNMCPKTLPMRKPQVKYIKQINYDNRWRQKGPSVKK
jgi:hypothetical protein